jgi:hypothetical protein
MRQVVAAFSFILVVPLLPTCLAVKYTIYHVSVKRHGQAACDVHQCTMIKLFKGFIRRFLASMGTHLQATVLRPP